MLEALSATMSFLNVVLFQNETRASVLLGINFTVRFYFELPLTCSNRIGLWSSQCGQVNQHQQVFVGQSPCAKTLNQPSLQTIHTLYIHQNRIRFSSSFPLGVRCICKTGCLLAIIFLFQHNRKIS